MIKPTIGRVVWFYQYLVGRTPDDQPLAAIITGVWGDRCVNLAVFGRNGVPMSHPPTSVQLLQDDDEAPKYGCYCTWMPYQLGRAASAPASSADPAVSGPVTR